MTDFTSAEKWSYNQILKYATDIITKLVNDDAWEYTDYHIAVDDGKISITVEISNE